MLRGRNRVELPSRGRWLMNRSLFVIPYVLVFVVLVACDPSEQTTQDDLSSRADAIVAALEHQEFDKVSSMLHYPPRYTAAERAEDQASIADGLAFVTSRIGTFQRYQRHDGSGFW